LERSAKVCEEVPAECEGGAGRQGPVGEREAAKDIARILDISAGRTVLEILEALRGQQEKYPVVLFCQI
jgi:hypothetical protein